MKMETLLNTQFAALGRISVGYADLEDSISIFIWSLVSSDLRVGQAITARLDFRQSVDLLRALFRLLPCHPTAVETSRLAKLLDDAERAVEKRDNVIHQLSLYSGANGPVPQHLRTGKRRAEWTDSPRSIETLADLAREIDDAVEALNEFIAAHFGEKKLPPTKTDRTLYGAAGTAPHRIAIQAGRRHPEDSQ
jgi:hypothetical protein